MEKDNMKNLLIKTAFACMACDGIIDVRELECVNKFIQDEEICEPNELKIHLNSLVDEFNRDSNEFMTRFFKELKNAVLRSDDQLKIIEYALAIIRADEEIDYREIKFFKIIRSLLPVSYKDIRGKFEDIEEFLEEDILSDPLKPYYDKSFFSSVSTDNIKLMHVGPEDK